MGYPISSNALSRPSDHLQRLTTDNAGTPIGVDYSRQARIASVHTADSSIEPLHEPVRMVEVGDFEVRDYENTKSTLWSKVGNFVQNHKLATGMGVGLVVLGALASYKALAATTSSSSAEVHQHGGAQKLYVPRPEPGLKVVVPEPNLNPVITRPAPTPAKPTTASATTVPTTTVETTQAQAPSIDCLKIVDTDLMHNKFSITNGCDEDVSVKVFFNRARGKTLSDLRYAVASGESQEPTEPKGQSIDKHKGIEFQRPGNYSTFETAPWHSAPDFFQPKQIQIQVANNLMSTVSVTFNDCKTLGDHQCMPMLSKANNRPLIQHRVNPGQAPVIEARWYPSEGQGRQLKVSYSGVGTIYSASNGRIGNDVVVADQITNATRFETLDKNHDGILKGTHRLVLADKQMYATKDVNLVGAGKMGGEEELLEYVDSTSQIVVLDAKTEDATGNFPESNIVRRKTGVKVGSEKSGSGVKPDMTFHVVIGDHEYNMCDKVHNGQICSIPAGTTELKARIHSEAFNAYDFTSFSGAEIQKNDISGRGVCLKSTDNTENKELSALMPGSRCS